MSVDKIIASIPRSTEKQRKTMRERALSTLQDGGSASPLDAGRLLKALDDYEAEDSRIRTESHRKTIADLGDSSLTKRVQAAFRSDPASDTEFRLIQALLDHPGATCAELSASIGWHPDAWDMGFGSVCSQRREYFEATLNPLRGDKSPNIPLLALQERGEDGKIRYTMRPEAAEAFKALGFRTKTP